MPKITPNGIKIKTSKEKDRVLKEVDVEIEHMLKAVRRSEVNYKREQEEARNREQQLRLTSQTIGQTLISSQHNPSTAHLSEIATQGQISQQCISIQTPHDTITPQPTQPQMAIATNCWQMTQ